MASLNTGIFCAPVVSYVKHTSPVSAARPGICSTSGSKAINRCPQSHWLFDIRHMQRAVLAGSLAGSTGAGTGGSSGTGGSGNNSSSGGGSDGSGGKNIGPHSLRLWTFIYAALLGGGGIAAYVSKGSTKSLSSSLGSALILALSARSMVGTAAKGNIAVCLALSLLLSVVMAGRYSRSRKLMPAGLVAGVSVAMSAAYLGSLLG